MVDQKDENAAELRPMAHEETVIFCTARPLPRARLISASRRACPADLGLGAAICCSFDRSDTRGVCFFFRFLVRVSLHAAR